MTIEAKLYVREKSRYRTADSEQVLAAAQQIVDKRMVRGTSFKDPSVACEFFRDKLGCRDALYLDGTLSQIYVGGNYYGAPAFMVKPYAGIFAVFANSRK